MSDTFWGLNVYQTASPRKFIDYMRNTDLFGLKERNLLNKPAKE